VRESRWGSEREQVARVCRLSVSVAICTLEVVLMQVCGQGASVRNSS
jgi:hypothetical protein